MTTEAAAPQRNMLAVPRHACEYCGDRGYYRLFKTVRGFTQIFHYHCPHCSEDKQEPRQPNNEQLEDF